MVYLNNEFEGGATSFYTDNQECYTDGDDDDRVHAFKPSVGDCLIFNSGIVHDGGVLATGTKYILRSEVMYRSALDDEQPHRPTPSPVPEWCVAGARATYTEGLDQRECSVISIEPSRPSEPVRYVSILFLDGKFKATKVTSLDPKAPATAMASGGGREDTGGTGTRGGAVVGDGSDGVFGNP